MILLLFVVSLDTLPRQIPFQQVNHHVTNSLQVISSTLLNPQVCIYTSIPCSTSQILILAVRNMLMCLRITVLLTKTVINYENNIRFPPQPNQVIVRFDITMDVTLWMHELNTLNHLISNHNHSLQREFPVAQVEQIFNTRTKKIDHHHIAPRFLTPPVQHWDTNTPL
jgi:hypothetical protein